MVRKRPYRPHGQGRTERIASRLDRREYAAVCAAAAAAGLTPAGYAAEATLAAAAQRSPQQRVLADLVEQLAAGRVALQARGRAVNAAVAELHRTGRIPRALPAAVTVCLEAVLRIDAMAEQTVQRLVQERHRRPPHHAHPH